MQNFHDAMFANDRAFLQRFAIATTVEYLVSLPYAAVDGYCKAKYLYGRKYFARELRCQAKVWSGRNIYCCLISLQRFHNFTPTLCKLTPII
jgi:hypothetical protein